MTEVVQLARIEFLGEEGYEEHIGKVNHELKIFQFFSKETGKEEGFIPFSAIKKITILGQKEIETQYALSVASGG